MARGARQLPEEGLFHVLARGNNRAEIFHRPTDFLAYLGIFGKTAKEFPVRLHHYCLMPNHVHLLLSAGPPNTALSELMHRVQLSYAIYYRSRYDYSGHLWQGRFKSLWIESEKGFFLCAAYIELNPVAAGIVENPADYQFSSYSRYTLGMSQSYLSPHPLYQDLGETEEKRKAVYQAIVAERQSHRDDDQLSVGFPKGVAGRPVKRGGNRDVSRNVPISSGR